MFSKLPLNWGKLNVNVLRFLYDVIVDKESLIKFVINTTSTAFGDVMVRVDKYRRCFASKSAWNILWRWRDSFFEMLRVRKKFVNAFEFPKNNLTIKFLTYY